MPAAKINVFIYELLQRMAIQDQAIESLWRRSTAAGDTQQKVKRRYVSDL